MVLTGFTSIVLISCNKGEGTGGEGTIKGKVFVKEYDNNFETLQRIIPAADEDVFIIYGNNSSIGDRVKSSFDGSYQFDFLRDGKYKVYAYSDDTLGNLGAKSKVLKNVSLSGGDVTNVDTIFICKGLDVDKGNATITGKLWLINYKSNGFEIKDIALAQEVDVYLIYNDHKSFDLRTRTNYDGTYQFTNLIKGKYTVYAYSEQEDDLGNLTGATEKVAKKKIFTISEDFQEFTVIDTIKTF